MVVIRRLAQAVHEDFMRAGDQHQRTIEVVIVGQDDRGADRAHLRHAILGVPGLEVRVPVEALALEARLVVDARLVEIDIAPQDLARAIDQARVFCQLAEALGQEVHGEDGTNLAALGLGDGEITPLPLFVVEQRCQLGLQRLDFFRRQEFRLEQEAVTLETLELLGAQRPLIGTRVHDGFAALLPQMLRRLAQARRIGVSRVIGASVAARLVEIGFRRLITVGIGLTGVQLLVGGFCSGADVATIGLLMLALLG